MRIFNIISCNNGGYDLLFENGEYGFFDLETFVSKIPSLQRLSETELQKKVVLVDGKLTWFDTSLEYSAKWVERVEWITFGEGEQKHPFQINSTTVYNYTSKHGTPIKGNYCLSDCQFKIDVDGTIRNGKIGCLYRIEYQKRRRPEWINFFLPAHQLGTTFDIPSEAACFIVSEFKQIKKNDEKF